MRLRLLSCALAVSVLALAASPLAAQNATIEELCRLHGIGGEESVAKVKAAYIAARDAGISEDELFPFVEDILKHKLDCGQMERILSSTTKLRRASLPYYVVFSKVREGVAKDAPPALVVEAAESKAKTLFAARDVLSSLESRGYRVRDFQNAAVIVSSYLEKGYAPGELVSEIAKKGVAHAGFAALSGVLEAPRKRKGRRP